MTAPIKIPDDFWIDRAKELLAARGTTPRLESLNVCVARWLQQAFEDGYDSGLKTIISNVNSYTLAELARRFGMHEKK